MRDALLLVGSFAVWLTFLLAVLRSAAAAVAGFAMAVAGLIVMHGVGLPLGGQSIRALLWGSLALAALLCVVAPRRQHEREVSAFTLLGSAILLIFALCEPTVDALLGSALAVVVSLVVAGIASWIQRRDRRKQRERPFRAALQRLQTLPVADREQLLGGVIRSLSAAPAHRLSMAELARVNALPWEEAWILSAALRQGGAVSYASDQDMSPDAVVLLGAGFDQEEAPNGRAHSPISRTIENLVINAGGEVTMGDSNHVSGGQVTGAVGRNKVRDISSSVSGGQHQTVTKESITAEARRVAMQLDTEKAEELKEAAEDIERAEGRGGVRKAVRQVLAIAAEIGKHGAPLFELAKQYLQGSSGS